MAEHTAIQWCDSTFNPWVGCTKVGSGCDHCYAEAQMSTRLKFVGWGAGVNRKRTAAPQWNQPVRWNAQADEFRQCDVCGWRGLRRPRWAVCPTCKNGLMQPTRRRVFCASLADWLDNEVPIEWLVDLLDLIRRTPNLDWLLLSKRIGNWRSRLLAAGEYVCKSDAGATSELAVWIKCWYTDWLPPNVWLSATVVNQTEADRDIPKLLAIPAAVRFLSIEPMLGAVDLRFPTKTWAPDRCDHCCNGDRCDTPGHFDRIRCPFCRGTGRQKVLDWVIAGGESGPQARPSHPDWFRSLRDQCAAAGVPFLFKQWGAWQISSVANGHYDCDMARNKARWVFPDGATQKPSAHRDGWTGGEPWAMVKVGEKRTGRRLDGIEHNGFPEATHG